jgi:hypothetical protein
VVEVLVPVPVPVRRMVVALAPVQVMVPARVPLLAA